MLIIDLKGHIGPYGSTESINVNGTLICPLVTWDSKITTVVAMLGGIASISEKFMKEDIQTVVNNTLYKRFEEVINREYLLKFPRLEGEHIPFGLPNTVISHKHLKDFSLCK